MKFDEFSKTLDANHPPAGVNTYLLSLWYDAKGDWNKAHELIQDMPDQIAAWIHAYLHRKEGDTGNAAYWYNRAHRNMPGNSLISEWEDIAKWLLAQK